MRFVCTDRGARAGAAPKLAESGTGSARSPSRCQAHRCKENCRQKEAQVCILSCTKVMYEVMSVSKCHITHFLHGCSGRVVICNDHSLNCQAIPVDFTDLMRIWSIMLDTGSACCGFKSTWTKKKRSTRMTKLSN